MAATYIPRNDAELILWLSNYRTQLKECGSKLGLTDEQIKAEQSVAETISNSILADEQKYTEWQAATAHTAELKEKTLPLIQRTIEHLRHTATWNEEYTKKFMAVPKGARKSMIASEIKPVIRASYQGGKVRIFWTRGSLDGINIYVRTAGTEAWRKLDRDTRPPFDDATPAARAGEVREYRVVGVIDDEEVGQPSDIVTVMMGT